MDLQTLINAQTPNGTLELPPGEFFGQVVIDRPLTILGHGKSTWIGSRCAPTIQITSSGVKLRSLTVEVTTGSEHVAIEASPGTDPVLENIIVNGLVVGVPGENIRDQVIEDEPAQSTRISFLPPPPLSPSDSAMPANIQALQPPSWRQANPSAPSPPLYNFSPGGDPTPVPESAPAAHSIGPVLGIFGDPWKMLLIGISVVLGIVALLQYVDTGKGSTKQNDDLKVQINKAEADNQQLTQEIDDLKAAASTKEKESGRLTAINVARHQEIWSLRQREREQQREIQSLKGDNQRLQQEIARLTSGVAPSARSDRTAKATAKGGTRAPDQKPQVHSQDADLINAAKRGDLALVEQLLVKGSKIEARDSEGRTPLLWACYLGRSEVVAFLLDKGADPNSASYDGWTPLISAVQDFPPVGYSPGYYIVRLLLARGADTKARSKDGQTALDLVHERQRASKYGDFKQIIETLKAGGAPLGQK